MFALGAQLSQISKLTCQCAASNMSKASSQLAYLFMSRLPQPRVRMLAVLVTVSRMPKDTLSYKVLGAMALSSLGSAILQAGTCAYPTNLSCGYQGHVLDNTGSHVCAHAATLADCAC